MSAMIKDVQKKKDLPGETAHPATKEHVESLKEIIKAKLPVHPEQLKNPSGHVIAIGGDTSVFAVMQDISGKDGWGPEDVRVALESVLGKNDEEIYPLVQKETTYVVPKLTLLLTIMEECGIEKVTYKSTNGSTPGMLITPELWS